MKVLFVCIANVNRSQIAEAIFNKSTEAHHASSAGLKPARVGGLVRNEHNNPVDLMRERGYDISKARIKRLTKKAADSADRVILLFGKKHLSDAPSYLKGHPGLEFWKVDSISDEIPFEEYCALERARIDQIEGRVSNLVKRLEQSAGTT